MSLRHLTDARRPSWPFEYRPSGRERANIDSKTRELEARVRSLEERVRVLEREQREDGPCPEPGPE